MIIKTILFNHEDVRTYCKKMIMKIDCMEIDDHSNNVANENVLYKNKNISVFNGMMLLS